MTREEEIRQAAYKEVERLSNNYDRYGGTPDYEDIQFAFEFGAEWADAHQPSPWISVDERLPEIKKRVLFLCNNGKAYFGYNNIDNDSATITNAPDEVKVTHWMPIPELQTTK